MATSDGYAQTGHALHWLLQHGHAGLSDMAGDLVMATRARDQVLTNLFFSGLYIVGATHESVEFGAEDMLPHPVRGLTEMLRRTPASRLEGPAPPTSSLRHPRTRRANMGRRRRCQREGGTLDLTGTTGAAHGPGLERTRPADNIVVVEPIDSTAGDRSRPQGGSRPAGNHVAWSLTADVAASPAP